MRHSVNFQTEKFRMDSNSRQFAIVTGASSGIGYELAKLCAENGFDLLIAADQPKVHQVAQELQNRDVNDQAVEADLSTHEGVNKLYSAAGGRRVDGVLAN